MTAAQNLLLDKLQKLDKEIQETDRALVHLNKQVGSKMAKYKDLNTERTRTAQALKELQTEG